MCIALNLKREVVDLPGPTNQLRATSYKRFGLTGAQVAIIGCAFGDLRRVMQEVVGAAPDLPHSPLGGPWAWDAASNRASYLIDTHGNVSEQTVEPWIAFRSRPTTAVSFSRNFGSRDNLNGQWRCGLRLCKRQSRGIVFLLTRWARVRRRQLQWVLPLGLVCNGAVTRASRRA